MIDLAGIAGKFTGRAASDGAPQGAAGQSLPGEDPATGGFAALVRLAAESEAGPGFVANNAQAPGVPPLPLLPSMDAEIAPQPHSIGAFAQKAADLPNAAALPESAPQPQEDGDLVITADDADENADETIAPAIAAADATGPAMSLAMMQSVPLPAAQPPEKPSHLAHAPAQAMPDADIAVGSQAKPASMGSAAVQDLEKMLDAANPHPFSPEIATTMQPARSRQTSSVNARGTEAAALSMDMSGRMPPARADETSPAFAAPPGLSDNARTTEDSLQTSAPLRSIVDGLPPMIQSELAAQPVRAVVGPDGGATTADALGEQVIDMGVSGQWIDRMAQEIAGLATGTGHSRFTLSPPHLGRVQVDLWQGQDATNVRLMAETDEAARRLAEGSQSLAADARLTALSLGMVTVEKASAPFDSGREQRQDQRQSGDLSGQAQQNGQNQAQARSGNGGNSNHGNGQGSEWVRRFAPDQPHEASDTSPRASGSRSANGRVRFA
jgi:flagellar hook-length control protein FliK